MDDSIVFRPLNAEEIRSIAALMMNELSKRLALQEITLQVGDGVYDFLAEKGFDPVYGARPLRRTILRLVEDPISEGILSRAYNEGDTVEVTLADGELQFHKVGTAAATDAPETGDAPQGE